MPELEIPEDFDVQLAGLFLSAQCLRCWWRTEGNASDSRRFHHSLTVHAWHFCPPRKD